MNNEKLSYAESSSKQIGDTGKNEFVYFSGNNYLGLAKHPQLINAATNATKKYGTNFFASRVTTGTSKIHLELEKRLTEFKDQEDAVVFASGYLGNKLLLDALSGKYSVVFIDNMAHPSIIDSLPHNLTTEFYDRSNIQQLESLFSHYRKYRPLVITDGVFAITGEIAPLDKIYPLVEKYDGLLIVDDAHATGVLGKNGRGTPEYYSLDGAPKIFQSETMSKAIGAYGGFLAANKDIISLIRKKSTFYRASTALPPPIVAAACSSVKYILEHPELRENLFRNTTLIRKRVSALNFETLDCNTPIIPLFFKDFRIAQNLSDFLKTNRIIAPVIDYPVKSDKVILRITVSSAHTKEQIKDLLHLLKKWKDETAGYSGTPLAKKLGIKNGFKIRIINEPKCYFDLFSDLPTDLSIIPDNDVKKDFIHYFSKSSSELKKDIKQLKQEIEQNGIIWISWPKKAANMETDLNGNIVRETGLRNGLVDIKVCAVNEIWSGLKFVIPVKDRK